MPVPTLISQLSTTASLNSPDGAVDVPSSIDDYQRAHAAFIAQLYANTVAAPTVIVPSATTTDIGAAASENVDISGNTTITGFGTVAEGINRKGRFTGVLTLTHNATSLILPGNADITTAANDRYEARSLGGGNWIVTKYVYANGSVISATNATNATTTTPIKLQCRAATTANITLAGSAPNTLDGVTLAANDRILVKAQSTGSQNGLYYVSTLGTGSNGTWTRTTDADGAGDMFGGMLVSVSEGTAGGNSLWMLTTDDPITIGTTALAWERKDAQGLLTTANSWTGQQSFTGTAATAPAIAGASDPNTGVFFPAADTVGVATGGVERLRVNSAGNLLVINPASLGYGAGAGGTVTQLTDKSTAVTLNTPAGRITTHNAALNGNTLVVFQFNNSLITTEDVVVFTFSDGNGVNYNVWAYALAAGNCQVALKNITAGSLSNAIPINFAIIKVATS